MEVNQANQSLEQKLNELTKENENMKARLKLLEITINNPKPNHRPNPVIPNLELPRKGPQKWGNIKVDATQDKPARILTDDLEESLDTLNSFSNDQMKRVVKGLKLNERTRSRLQQSSQSNSVVSVLRAWESQTKPLEQPWGTVMQRRTIHAMINTLREVNRKDIVDKIRENKGLGFVGANFKNLNIPISQMAFTIRHKLSQSLSIKCDNGADWRGLAEHLRMDPMLIQLWDQRNSNPGEELLLTWQTKHDATIGNLYNILVDLEMQNSAGILEE